MPITDADKIKRIERWRRPFELAYWPAIFAVYGLANSLTALMEWADAQPAFHRWEPVVWETSSVIAGLMLVPAVIWFSRQVPWYWGNWRRFLMGHLAASLAFCLAHVLIMVALRHGAYALADQSYQFGNWASGLVYEYLKDIRTYAAMVLMIEGYRFFLHRLHGEARWLDPAIDVASRPPERPERFLVKMLGREFLVAADDIEWTKAEGNYVNLHVRGRDFPLRSTLSGLLEHLDPDKFARVHRSYLVRLDCIAQIETLDSGDARLQLRDGAVVPCSRRYRKSLRSRDLGLAS